jgi:hypothetical protein
VVLIWDIWRHRLRLRLGLVWCVEARNAVVVSLVVSIPTVVSIAEFRSQEISVSLRRKRTKHRGTILGMKPRFAITYDYLCPFARNANESVVEALRDGAGFDVSFVPFSLEQNHAHEGATPQWELQTNDVGPGVLALLWSLAVRENYPDSFLEFHVAMFTARHDDGADISDPPVIEAVVDQVGLDVGEVRAVVESGVPANILAAEHTESVELFNVFGVPTFIQGDEAVFVRFMERHSPDDLDRVLDMLSWTNLNEFKRTTVPR